MQKSDVQATIALINDGGQNTALEARNAWNDMLDYMRQNNVVTITHSDASSLAGKIYEYTIVDPDITTLIIDGTGNPSSGFYINKITPHADFIDGQEIMLLFSNEGGITPETAAAVTSNFMINRNKYWSPVFDGTDNYIAQNAGNTSGTLNGDGLPEAYGKNLFVILRWSTNKTRWIEVQRGEYDIF